MEQRRHSRNSKQRLFLCLMASVSLTFAQERAKSFHARWPTQHSCCCHTQEAAFSVLLHVSFTLRWVLCSALKVSLKPDVVRATCSSICASNRNNNGNCHLLHQELHATNSSKCFTNTNLLAIETERHLRPHLRPHKLESALL